RRRHTRSKRDWSSDVCSSDLTPWAVTQNPGLVVLSYFVSFFGQYADWKIYLAYDILAFAVYAAVMGGLGWRQYRLAVPLAAILRSEERRVGHEWRSRGQLGRV